MALRGTIAAGFLAVAGIGSAAASNLLTNSDFDVDFSGWTVDITGVDATATIDSFANPPPGSAHLDAPNPGSRVAVSQCVTLAAPLNVDLIANTYTDSSSGTSTNGVQIESYDTLDCAGVLLATQLTTEAVYATWGTRALPGYGLPAGTMSVRVSFFIDSGDTSESVHFDHIGLFADSIFVDGFDLQAP